MEFPSNPTTNQTLKTYIDMNFSSPVDQKCTTTKSRKQLRRFANINSVTFSKEQHENSCCSISSQPVNFDPNNNESVTFLDFSHQDKTELTRSPKENRAPNQPNTSSLGKLSMCVSLAAVTGPLRSPQSEPIRTTPDTISAEASMKADIVGETFENRFPWMRDIAIQCGEPFRCHFRGNASRPIRSHSSGCLAFDESTQKKNVFKRYSSVSETGRFETENTNNVSLGIDTNVSHAEDGEPERAALERYKGRRRPCIISNLNLGPEADEDDHTTETTENDVGEDVETTPTEFPRLTRDSLSSAREQRNSCEGYDSDSAIRDGIHEKAKSPKPKNFLHKFRTQKKNSPEVLDQYLRVGMKPSVFKDERISTIRHSHWREMAVTKDGETTSEVSESELKRLDAVWELFTTECVFLVDHLMVLKHVFLEPLKKCQVEGLLMNVEPFKLFGNLDELCHISYAFCRDFSNSLKSMTTPREFGSTNNLVKCLDKMTSNSRNGETYHNYLLNYKAALTYLQTLRNTAEEISVFERFCEADPRCNRLQLTDLLIAPMHHWTRLPLVLERIRKHTMDMEDISRLSQSIENVEASLKTLENKMEWLRTFERVKEIEKQLVWPSLVDMDSKVFIPDSLKHLVNSQPPEALADQVREILYEGQLILTEKDMRHTDVYAFLFSDLLLLTKSRKDNRKTKNQKSANEKQDLYHLIKQPISVDTISVFDISDPEASSYNMKNAFTITERNQLQQIVAAYTLQAHTSHAKSKWLKSITEAGKNRDGKSSSPNLPGRNESFKQLLDLDNHANLMANSQVLKIGSQSRSQQSCTDKMFKLQTTNTSHELLRSTSTSVDVHSSLTSTCPQKGCIFPRTKSAGNIKNVTAPFKEIEDNKYNNEYRTDNALTEQYPEEIEDDMGGEDDPTAHGAPSRHFAERYHCYQATDSVFQ